MTVVFVQSAFVAQPDEAGLILEHAGNRTRRHDALKSDSIDRFLRGCINRKEQCKQAQIKNGIRFHCLPLLLQCPQIMSW